MRNIFKVKNFSDYRNKTLIEGNSKIIICPIHDRELRFITFYNDIETLDINIKLNTEPDLEKDIGMKNSTTTFNTIDSNTGIPTHIIKTNITPQEFIDTIENVLLKFVMNVQDTEQQIKNETFS